MLRQIAIGLFLVLGLGLGLLPLIVSVLSASDTSLFRMLVLKSEEDLKRTTDFRICATYRWRAVITGATPAITNEVERRNLDCSVLPLGPTTYFHPPVRIPKLEESKLIVAQELPNLKGLYKGKVDVSQSYAKAARWYSRAAAKGYANAQDNPDFMHEKGRSAPRKAVLATARGDFRVQLGAFRSKARAVKKAKSLISLHKHTLGRLTIVPVRADLGSRGVYYRLRVGPFPDRATANSLCHMLSAHQQNCIMVKP